MIKDQEHYYLANKCLLIFCNMCTSKEGQCKCKADISIVYGKKPCPTALKAHKAFKQVFDKYDK